MSDFDSLIPPECRYLVDELGFRVTSGEVSPYFDNFYVTLTDGNLNVSIVRDRGFLGMDVSSTAAPTISLPLSLLSQLVLGADSSEPVSIGAEAAFLHANISEVKSLLATERVAETQARLLEIGRARLERLYPGSIRRT